MAVAPATASTQHEGIVTLGELQTWCAREERTLRLQYPEGALPAEWERTLASRPAEALLGALRRWYTLKHYHLVRAEQLAPAHRPAEAEARATAMRKLLRREPVVLELGPHRVHVTSRSYDAIHAMGRHAKRLRLQLADVEHLDDLLEATFRNLQAAASRRERRRHRARYRTLMEIQEAIVADALLQRRALYAHALTEDGAPASGPEATPAWVDQVDAAWDAALLGALQEAGPGRLAALGSAPGAGDVELEEDWGWEGFVADFVAGEIDAAPLFRADLAQMVARRRARARVKTESDETDFAGLDDALRSLD